MGSVYYGAANRSDQRITDASANITIGDHPTASTYSIRVTTGENDKVYVDVCGATATFLPSLDANLQKTANALKLRADTYTNTGTFITSYVTPALYVEDISTVVGTLVATQTNEGRKLAGAENLPMYFRTICGDMNRSTGGSNRSFRMTLKDDGKIANGMKVNIMAKVDVSTANVINSACDISFSALAGNTRGYPQVLVNGGPLGADAAIPAFSAVMTKNPTTATSGDVKVVAAVPMFKNGGAGIDLSNATFRIKEDGGSGTETFYTVTIPAAEVAGTQLPNADGLYEYALGTIASATGKSYRVMNTSVRDKFLVYGYAMQNSTNGLINIDNIASKISESTIKVDADSFGQDATFKTGTKAIVTFTAPTSAEGASSIKKYEARWATKAQAATLGDVSMTFSTFETNFPNQVGVNTDICATTNALLPQITLTGLTNSIINDDGTADDNTRYGVFVRAYTKDDAGNYVAGADAFDLSAGNRGTGSYRGTGPNKLIAANSTMKTDASMSFYVSGVPDAPTHVSIKTGIDTILSSTSNNKTQEDQSMNNSFLLNYNDYNVNMRGSHYDNVRYMVVQSKDVPYATDVPDASYTNISPTAAWNGNDVAVEGAPITIAAGAVNRLYNTATKAWYAAANDLSNGESFSVQYLFDNSNGAGFRTAWLPFVPSAHPDASAGLWNLDPSSVTHGGVTGAGWGYGSLAAGSAAAGLASTVDLCNVVTLSAADQLKRYNVVRNAGSIDFGFSLLNKTGKDAKAAGTAYKSPEVTDGGSEVNSIRYYVYKSAPGATKNGAAIVDRTPERIFGQTQRDVSQTSMLASVAPLGAAYAQSSPATKDTNRLSVSQGYDASGNLVNLKLGQRYDICFGLVNANGFNDLSLSTLRYFAPMGEISAVKNLRVGHYPPVMATNKLGATASLTQACFDISWTDLSGAAEHGGHLINRYTYGATQYQGSVSGDVPIFANFNLNAAANASFQTTNATLNGVRGADLTANAKVPLAGYPIKVSVTAVSVATSTPANNSLLYDNYFYNEGGLTKTGATATITIPGPKLAADSTDDEVKGLVVTPGDGKLTVSFYKPQNDALRNLYQGAPSVNAYYIYQYDMSLNTLGSTSERAVARTVTVINDATEIGADAISKDLTGINGKCYVIAVHTQWRYGLANDQLQTSQGVYHSNTASSTAVIDPSLVSGLWVLPAGARQLAGGLRQLDCAVPRGPPTIYADNTSMRFDDNGSAITVGAMVQVAPQNGSANTSAFYLDMCSANIMGGSTTVTQQTYNGQAIARNTYDICATTVLGTNWATEKNFVVVQNAAGSAYVKRNIA